MASIMKMRALREAEHVWDNILILGSGLTAPLIKDINLKNWKVLAINNAWKLGVYDWLIYPNDFNSIPTDDRINHIQHFDYFSAIKNIAGTQSERGNTMMFNAAYYAIAKGAKNIGFLGCDMHYPASGNTHFYGTGTPDPLRLGENNLMMYLNRLQSIADNHSINLYNFSPQEQVSMLPFQRAGIIKSKKSLFIAFNEPYINYAEVFIKSFWRYHKKSEWTIECFATNCSDDLCQKDVFNNPYVIINNEHIDFMNDEEERCYMNSMRFVRYADKLKDYDFVWMSDADAICLGNIDSLNFEMINSDIGICRNVTQDKKRMIHACSIAYRNTNKANSFFDMYTKTIKDMREQDTSQWFNDQIAILNILNSNSFNIYELDKLVYCSFQNTPIAKMLMTATPNKFNNIHYKREYDLLMNA